MVRGFWLFILLLFSPGVNLIKAHAGVSRIIYCIGNHDATGSCWMADGQNEERLDCLITSWPIVECQSIPEADDNPEYYGCLALQNTGIVNQISLSCEPQPSAEHDGGGDALSSKESMPLPNDELELESNLDASDQPRVLKQDVSAGNAFQSEANEPIFDVEQPRDFKQAF